MSNAFPSKKKTEPAEFANSVGIENAFPIGLAASDLKARNLRRRRDIRRRWDA